MLNLDAMRDIFKSANLLTDENDKNFIITCPYCGDKSSRSGHKHSHCYVSKNEAIPVAHCWYCNGSWPITKLLFDLTGKYDESVIKVDHFQKYKPVKARIDSKYKIYTLPKMELLNFPLKTEYMRTRTFGKLDIKEIPNLIFDTDEFFKINNIDPEKDLKLSKWEQTLLQHNFVVFLSKHHTMLYARNISKETKIPFRKIPLQKDNLGFLDYYEIDLNHPNSNIVILSEGNFDILGCYAYNTLKLNSKACCYASGCTFSYPELLKSVCFDRSIYSARVYVLSDNDKKEYHYRNFKRNAVMAQSIDIVYNRYGKDFGMVSQAATKVF